MHPEELALLRTVLERPADDSPRLVLADWWDERGQPDRAEFCRVQCELANRRDPMRCPRCNEPVAPQRVTSTPWLTRCSKCTWGHGPFWERTKQLGDEYEALRRRERELLTHANLAKWLPELPGLSGMTQIHDMETGEEHHAGWNGPNGVWITADFRRGFVDSVALRLAALLGGPCPICSVDVQFRVSGMCKTCRGTGRTRGCVEALFRSQPVTEVRLSDREAHIVRAVPSGPDMMGFWPEDNLPEPIRSALRGLYLTTEEAHAVLSAACVRLGRLRAGLD